MTKDTNRGDLGSCGLSFVSSCLKFNQVCQRVVGVISTLTIIWQSKGLPNEAEHEYGERLSSLLCFKVITSLSVGSRRWEQHRQ